MIVILIGSFLVIFVSSKASTNMILRYPIVNCEVFSNDLTQE